MSGQLTERAETPADFGKDKRGIAARWIAEIRLSEKDEKTWVNVAEKTEKRYLDIRPELKHERMRFNVFWSNVQTLKPAIYTKPPKAVVQRRYLDSDPVGRAASIILQRAIMTSIEQSEWHLSIDQAVTDYLVPGRGVCWARYEPHFRDVKAQQVQAGEAGEVAPMDPNMAPPVEGNNPADDGPQITDNAETYSEITYEEVCWDYVNWRDFRHSPARTWQEVRWVARRVLMDRDGVKERFGSKMAEAIPYDWKPGGMEEDDDAYHLFLRAVIYEIWDKGSRKVYWICPGYGEAPLDVKDDPLMLDGFFPCPRPLYATIANSSLMPRPDYQMYKDQALELDELTERIAALTRAIRASGVYDASIPELTRLMDETNDNELIPVTNWGGFSQSGGMKGAIDFLPIADMAAALLQMMQVREATKRDLYEITGISDIVRGQGMASATATAERIKGQFAQLRLRDRVNEVARFCRDMVRITGEIIAKHFDPQTLMLVSDYQQTTGATPEMAEKAIALIKNDQVRGFRIEIETDSTTTPDQQEEQQARVAFLQMAGSFLKEAVPLSMQVPAMAPLAAEMLLFGIRGFPVGRELETVFEVALEAMRQAQQQPQPEAPPPPDPAMEKVKADVALEQERLAFEREKAASDAMLKEREIAVREQEIALKTMTEDEKLTLERQRTEDDSRRENMKAIAEQASLKLEDRFNVADREIQDITQVQDSLMKMQTAIETMAQNSMAPRRVVIERGPDGRAIGARQEVA
jgi:hypothetical protein